MQAHGKDRSHRSKMWIRQATPQRPSPWGRVVERGGLPPQRPAGNTSDCQARICTDPHLKQRAWYRIRAQENRAGRVITKSPGSWRASPLTQHIHGARDAAVLTDAEERRHHLLHQFLQLQITLTGACGLVNTLEINIQERQRSVKSCQDQPALSHQVRMARLLHSKQ